jgi:cystathionine gamma-lyase
MTTNDHQRLAADLLHHFGRALKPGDSVVPSISPTAVFHLPGDPSNAHYQYGRYHNPTWEVLESALGLLEGAETLVFPSGMAAIAALLFTNVSAGERVLLPSDGYYTTRVLGEKFLKPLGVEIDTRPTATFLAQGFEGYRLVLIETPSNPGLEVCDIAAAAALAKRAGALLAVDNTTMTPLGQRPLELGAGIVVSADTKAINGHSDALMGHVASRHGEVMTRVRDWRRYAGAISSPFEAWLVYRGLETLEVRFSRMCATAGVIAERLAAHSCVSGVRYPGLAHDPSHAIARKQMTAFGSMITLTFRDGAAAERFIEACAYIQPSTSFGGVRTSAERRARWGDAVADGFVRLSIGLEPAEVLWAAMDEALKKAG